MAARAVGGLTRDLQLAVFFVIEYWTEMKLKTLLDRAEKHRSLAYGQAHWVNALLLTLAPLTLAMKPCLRQLRRTLAWLIIGLAAVSAYAAENLGAQLRAFAALHGVSVKGLHYLRDEPAKPVSLPDDPVMGLRQLLSGYNHVLSTDAQGRVDGVVVLSPKRASRAPRRFTIPIKVHGAHHIVLVSLAGPNGKRVPVPMVVDTGASTMVLPLSMMPVLGFNPKELRQGRVNTAGGEVSARFGTLALVEVSGARRREVAVSFVDDEALNGVKLLGMSFLSHYRVTLDQSAARLLLQER
ncbi:MAG: TIGR02281 family clan AA aspartic protease [Gammaproteobacteria bacterium]|nr:TIGR02281 family clan AA aspartic protease [Gammaproteobacteria bacterium]